jgi:hypothetical protein
MQNLYLLELFSRITVSPECGKFLKFLFNKVMYPSSTSTIPTTLLDKLGDESLFAKPEETLEGRPTATDVSQMSIATSGTSSKTEKSKLK